MPQRLPPLAILLGLAGLMPFAVLGFGTVGGPAEHAGQCLAALLAYGAVSLGFLGGVHWGLALAVPDGTGERRSVGERARLGLGVLPSLIGWVALLLRLAMPPETGLGLLIAGFIATAVIEDLGRRRSLVPGHYMWLRWGLTIVVVAILTTVLVLRLLGARIAV